MCLFTYQEQPVVADQPIECVKIMRRREINDELCNLFTFVYHTTYKLGVLTNMMVYDAQDIDSFECPKLEIGYRGSVLGGLIYRGFEAAIKKGICREEDKIRADNDILDEYRYRTLHRGICSFIDEEDAQKTFDWAIDNFKGCANEICLVKCEIPTGAKYWKGVSNCTGLECGYVSDQIIPREILKTQRTL